MKIHIYYRHYNVNDSDGPKRPKGFDYEKCFLNLLETLKGTSNYILNVFLTVTRTTIGSLNTAAITLYTLFKREVMQGLILRQLTLLKIINSSRRVI